MTLQILSTLRRIYRTYLSNILFFQWMKKIFLYLYFSDVLSRYKYCLIRPFRAQIYQFVSMSDFIARDGGVKQTLKESEILTISGPRFIGRYPISLASDKQVTIPSPELALVEMSNVELLGGTNFIIKNERVIHPDIFVASRDFCPAESFGIVRFKLDKEKIEINASKSSKSMEVAISLLGHCPGNYAHWLTEFLPKLILLEQLDELKEVPLVVDAWINPVFFSTIELFNKSNRDIIKLERWDKLKVERLFDLTPPAYIIPEYRIFAETGRLPDVLSDEFVFSSYALNLLRDSANEQMKQGDKKAKGDRQNKKLYLKRSIENCGNCREINNISEIEDLLKECHFDFVEPGQISFEEQISLFSDADVIVSPVGAALTNAIFTRPGCKIIALAAYFEKANYYFFSNLMEILGHELSYVLGPQDEMKGHPLHKNFSIDKGAFKEAMNQLCLQ